MLVMTPLFNREWYLTHNPDVAEAVAQGLVDPLDHFHQYGVHEGRSPGPLLDVQFYLHYNPDVAAAVARGETTAYDHFLSFGMFEGRAPIALFDASYYLAHNPDVAQAVRAGDFTPIQHFVEYGQYEGRIVTPIIDLGAYMGANPDVYRAVQDGEMSAMEHLMLYGIREKRDLGNGIDFGMMDGDPVFLRLLAEGKIVDALLRVTEVAPYLPDYGPPDPIPDPDPPDPGPSGWGTLENPYPLDANVSEYHLPNFDNYIKLADLSKEQIIFAYSDYNYFLATSSAALTEHLIIDGGCGCSDSELYATLDQPIDPRYAPNLLNIPFLNLTAKGVHPGIGLDLSNSFGVGLIANNGSTANLTVEGVRNPVLLIAKDIDHHEFIVEYIDVDPCGCGWDPQYLYMENAHLDRLSITAKDGADNSVEAITNLTITALGDNSIGSFDAGKLGLDASLTWITVTGAGSFELNVSELKGNGDCECDEVVIDFSSYSLAKSLIVTLAELDTDAGDKHDISDEIGERQSNQYVWLPCMEEDAVVEIKNMTLTSTWGYTRGPVQNDILDLTAWCLSGKEELAQSVASLTIKEGALVKEGEATHYLDFIFCVDMNGADSGGESTLILRNLVTTAEYNLMLEAIDTVNADTTGDLQCTLDLVGKAGLIEPGELSTEFSFTSSTIQIMQDNDIGTAAILGLIGVLVGEGSVQV